MMEKKKPEAIRPVFYFNDWIIVEQFIKFNWIGGLSFSQKVKNVASFHETIRHKFPNKKILEISTKSQEPLGNSLSAFNLFLDLGHNWSYPLESVYQSSKVFSNWWPYQDILLKNGKEAKQDDRLKNSWNLIGFDFRGEMWPLDVWTAFYDWLYINAVKQSKKQLIENMPNNAIFTDIEFNPGKSFACQARTCALIQFLFNNGYLNRVNLNEKTDFLSLYREVFDKHYSIVRYEEPVSPSSTIETQGSLF